MKYLYQILLSLLLCTQFALGQNSFGDDFSDLDFLSDPTWLGDTSKFIVNADSQLQLFNDAITDEALLYTNVNLKDTATWEFYFKMDFNPSGSNALQVALASDKPITSSDYSGYLLRIGESGGDDTWELLVKDGGSEQLMARGTDGLFAVNPEARLRVTVANGRWEVFADTGNGQFFNDGIINGYPLLGSRFFGITCDHTSTRSDKFHFDDFFISPIYQDTVPPKALSVEVVSDTALAVNFSELLADTSATNVNKYSISGVGAPQVIAANKDNIDPSRYILDLSSPVQNKQQYTLMISNLLDANGNILISQDLTFNYFKPEVGDLIINELFPDPTPPRGLPDAEFIELYNPTNFSIPLSGFKISDATDTVEFTKGEILPQSYVIICDKDDESAYQPFGKVVGIPGFPALNNSGDNIRLLSPENVLFDKVQYTSDWYQDEDKKSGGWTLERIAPEPLCRGKANWRASLSQTGGTPGAENSIAGISIDTIAPHLVDVIIVDHDIVQLRYNEAIATLPSSITFTEKIDSAISITLLSDPTTLEIKLSSSIEQGVFYEIIIEGVLDCYQNGKNEIDTGNFIDPFSATVKDIIINEILFNPESGGVDYLEIYNRSDKILSLHGFKVVEWDTELKIIDTESEYDGEIKYIYPRDYITFTSDSLVVSNQYEIRNPERLLEMSGFPNFPDEGGIVVIYSSDSVQLDSLSYSEDWHYDLLADENGVSLERISFEGETNDPENWFSASSASGFGTPTFKNSQFYTKDAMPGEITLTPEVFSPDQDGYKDFLSINIKMEEPGYTVTIQVFDSRGRFIMELANNQLISSETTYRWDGIDSEGMKAQPGIYIVNIQMFHLNGRTLRENRKCVLAERR